MVPAVEGQCRSYEGALWALRFVEGHRAIKRRFRTEGDATWASFRGEFGASARIDLLLPDADAQWPSAFGARAVYDLTAGAAVEPFGAAWAPPDDEDGDKPKKTRKQRAPVAATVGEDSEVGG